MSSVFPKNEQLRGNHIMRTEQGDQAQQQPSFVSTAVRYSSRQQQQAAAAQQGRTTAGICLYMLFCLDSTVCAGCRLMGELMSMTSSRTGRPAIDPAISVFDWVLVRHRLFAGFQVLASRARQTSRSCHGHGIVTASITSWITAIITTTNICQVRIIYQVYDQLLTTTTYCCCCCVQQQ